MTADELIKQFNLKPLDIEGGFFCRTYTSSENHSYIRKISSAIYYLITPDSFSRMHKLVNSDEMFHFYYGDPVEMLLLHENGKGESITLSNQPGPDFNPQQVVPKNCWQGARLKPGGKFALLGVTVTPEFIGKDFVIGSKNELITHYPEFTNFILSLTE